MRNNLGVSQKYLGAKEIFTWGVISVMQSRIDVTKMFVITNSFIHSFIQAISYSYKWLLSPYVCAGAISGTAFFFFSMFNLPSLLFNHMGYIYTNYFNVFPTITRIYVSSGVVTMDWFFLLIMGQIFLLITADMIDMKNDRYGTFYHESESLKSIFICMPRL